MTEQQKQTILEAKKMFKAGKEVFIKNHNGRLSIQTEQPTRDQKAYFGFMVFNTEGKIETLK